MNSPPASSPPAPSPQGPSSPAEGLIPPWALPVSAAVEAVSLAALLINLMTAHVPALAAALGPVHGCAYLAAIALTWAGRYPRRARWLALVPGIGAGLAVRAGQRIAPPAE